MLFAALLISGLHSTPVYEQLPALKAIKNYGSSSLSNRQSSSVFMSSAIRE